MLKQKVKFDETNIGRKIKIRGEEYVIKEILSNKKSFRVVTGEGVPVIDYTFDDIEDVSGLVIDIK